jgi:hypothetical protein
MKILENAVVFPSTVPTIVVHDDQDVYGGAHLYSITNCKGFKDGETQYDDPYFQTQTIQFVQKNDDGTMIPGLQSEQLVLMLIDRQEKLNARFPSEFNTKAIAGLKMFLEAQKERVDDRIARGVMGDLKK